jgi:hypothetical protein
LWMAYGYVAHCDFTIILPNVTGMLAGAYYRPAASRIPRSVPPSRPQKLSASSPLFIQLHVQSL